MYSPQINDYVKWTKGVEGWVYFVDRQYITIETQVFPKDSQNIQDCYLHRNNRLLILCYANQWEELQLLGHRENKYSETIIPIKE
jgi:hypothetical protein